MHIKRYRKLIVLFALTFEIHCYLIIKKCFLSYLKCRRNVKNLTETLDYKCN